MDDFMPQMADEAPSNSGAGAAPEKDKDEGSETALIPKSLLAGKQFKPGDEVVLRIVRDYEDEVEVEYATEEGGKGEGEMGPGRRGAYSEFDAMTRD